MNLKKIACIVLVLCMCIPVLASCTSGPQVATKGQANSSLDTQYPNADYAGEKFTFLEIKHDDLNKKDYYGGEYLDAESITGDTISDAVYERNLKVEEKYNVDVESRKEPKTAPAEILRNLVMAGDFSYDAIYGWGYKMGACIVENYFADFSTLPNIDLEKEYWGPSAIEDLTVGDSIYLCINDISMNKLEHAGFYFYNKAVYEDFNIEGQFGNIYEHVKDGTWTLDLYLEMVKAVNSDLDGDSVISRDDIFGLVDGNGLGVEFLHTSGITYTTKNDDGSYNLNIYSEKSLKIIEKVHAVYSNDKYVKNYDELINGADITGYDDQYQYARSVFTTGHSLFCGGSANATSEAPFRNMEDDYGIVPMPKYDKDQENYVSPVSSLASIFAIPATTRQDGVSTASMERTGMILEYMAFKSNEIVLPKYYDQVLKGQRLDGEDAEMLDIIRSTIRYEIAEMTSEEPTITKTLEEMFKKPSTATSKYNANKSKIQRELDDFYTEVLLLGTEG